MRVVIAPDSFKGTLRARDVAHTIASEWRRRRPHDTLIELPMADGGEGTIEAFEAAYSNARRIPVTVTGPLGDPVDTSWLHIPSENSGGTAVVELATTSGIELTPNLNARAAHTVGFGEAIRDALTHNVHDIVLAIGSSASTDGGAGMLTALGATILDSSGQPLPAGGSHLTHAYLYDESEVIPVPPGGVIALSDVNNPLLGRQGAARVFGPQKGATPQDVQQLENALSQFAAVTHGDIHAAGAGAAGGTGYGITVWGGTTTPGAAAIAKLTGLEDQIANASLVVTGEGRYDGVLHDGKAPSHVLSLAQIHGIPSAIVAGTLGVLPPPHVVSVSLSILAGSREAAMADAHHWLEKATAEIITEVAAP